MLIVYRVTSGQAWKKETLQVALSAPEFSLPTTTKEGKASISPDLPDRTTASISPFFPTVNERRLTEKSGAGFSVEHWTNRDPFVSEVRRNSRSLSADQCSMAWASDAQPTVKVDLLSSDGPSSSFFHSGSPVSIAGDDDDHCWLSSPLSSEPFQCCPPAEYRRKNPSVSLEIDLSCLTAIAGPEPSSSMYGESSRSSGSRYPLLHSHSCHSLSGDELTPTPSSSTLSSALVVEKPSKAKLPPPHPSSLRNVRSMEGLPREPGGRRGRALSVNSQNRKVTRQTWPASRGP